MVLEVKPKQLDEMIKSGKNVYILDVRRNDEIVICRIPNSVHIPMDQIANKLNDLPDYSHPIVAVCHHGKRGGQVADYLEKSGYTNVMNLTGGIDAWAHEIDPQMKRY